MRVVEFKSATVEIHDHIIRTIFREDGSSADMWPPTGEAWYQDVARSMGYTDALLYAREHELVHHWLADHMGWPHSWSVWSQAHGTWDSTKPNRPWSQRVADEEHIVNRLQRYLNTGEVDVDYGVLTGTWGERLPAVAVELMGVLRPRVVLAA